MKKISILSLLLCALLGAFAQDLNKNAALDLVKNNAKALGLTEEGISASIVSSAYNNDIAGTQMVYLLQGYKGLPVYNKLQTLAFKNGKLLSATGDWIKNIQELNAGASAQPSVTAEAAVKTAMAKKNVFPAITGASRPVNGLQKQEFGKMDVSLENVTAELMWVPVNNGKSVELAWQVFFVPKTSSDYWLIRVDANTNAVLGETNLTVYCNFDSKEKHSHSDDCTVPSNPGTENRNKAVLESPQIVNNAQYRVIPFPAESPKHNNGIPALVSNPWNAAPNNATTLKWHSDGTLDYNYTRGNNVWAYQDRLKTNTPTVAASATSTTSPDPLTFNFIPDFTSAPTITSPQQNQQFNITNLFYWNNVTHDVLYQYGFTEAAGNFQASNLGRGGVGNDYVLAEAQDGNGTNNANFSTPADGGRPRMQMYLWDGPAKTEVNSPSSIAGTYESIEGVFSTANRLLSVGPVTAQLVYYIDSITPTNDACTQASNSAALAGKIALINRNTCSFVIKVKNAQLAGAVGVIMVNNVAGAPIAMGGTDNTITIPAVMISQANGAILAGQLANNVNVTLSAVGFDGDVDNGIIVHEYAHGISNRLTGGPAAAGCLSNGEQAGEGWSDYYALMLTQDWASSNVNSGFTSPRSIGTYAIGETPAGLGIRSQRYSTDFTVNNLVYLNTLPGTGLQHSRGEIWAATLWDMTWNIIQQANSITPDIYNASGTGGNIIALKLVTEGLKLQPCSPGFIDGRDAILKADQILYNGQYSCAIREAFRRRGMGFYASQGDGNLTNDQVSDYSPFINFTIKPSVTQALEGANITYTHTINTCSALSNYIIRDTLPSNVTYVSGGTYDAATRVVSFAVNLASAGAQTYAFTVSVNAGSYYAPTTYLSETVPTTTFPTTLTQASTSATTWTVSSAQSHSAPNSMFSGNAIVISDETLTTTTAITLGTKQSSLSFWHLYDTEAKYDGGVIEISTDNGTTWSDLGEKISAGYYNGTMDAATGTPIAGRKAYTGTITSFIKTEVNLSSYAGMSTKYRWRFNSDDGTAQTGWYVDDILVKNEAAVNIRASLFNTAGTRIEYADTVTLITQVIVCDNVAIITQPANTSGCAGGNASFSVTASGSTPLYQWQVSTDAGVTYANITGATAATLTLTGVTAGMNNNRYRVIVNNTCPSSVTSTGATLSVSTPTTISSQPASVTVCSGANTSFTVIATGTAVTYQWQVSTDGGTTFNNITGATTATLSLTSVTTAMNTNQYRAVLSSCIPGLVSSAAILTVNAVASITTQPANTSACAGNNATFTVVAAGTAITYQWQLSTDGGTNYTNISGATTATLTLSSVTSGMNNNRYRVMVSNSCPSSVTSTGAILTVATPSTITGQPISATVCAGANTTFTVTATGTGVSFQWQVSTNGGTTWADVSGATTASLTLNAVTAAMNSNQYRVVLSSCTPGGVTSNTVTLTVNSPANITTQPASVVACSGNNATFTVAATGTFITYQWQMSTNGGTTWTNITGATAASYSVTAATTAMNGNQYRVVISGTCAPASVTSSAATLTVNNSITVTSQPMSTAVCAGANVTFTTAATGSGLTYQWQVSTNGGTTFTNITGATTATLNLPAVTPAQNGNQYKAVLNGACASNISTSIATLTVNSSVTITTQPTNQIGCAPAPATFTIAATGTSVTYQWQISTNGGTTWTNIAGAMGTSYTITSLTPSMNANQFRVVATGSPCGSVTSNAANLVVGSLPVVTIAASPSTTLAPSTTTTLSTTVTPTGTYTYQWFKNNVAVSGATNSTLAVNADGLGVYKVLASNANGCSNYSDTLSLTASASMTLFVYPNPNRGVFQVRYFNAGPGTVKRSISVYDSKGSRVYNKQYDAAPGYTKMEVVLSNAMGGLYTVDVRDSNEERIATSTVLIK